jgi:aminoglycoside 6'-N-acetyltransferase I
MMADVADIILVDLTVDDEQGITQAARLLVDGFQRMAPGTWPDMDSALEEVHEALKPGKIARQARAADGTLLGWIGAQPQYDQIAWELHPLVVAPQQQGRGLGRRLVLDLETQLRARGCLTVFLGTDDEAGLTSLSGVDLYPDVLGKAARIENRKQHPYGFYQRLGYVIVGVIPDANGLGKPDILMAKRLE